MSKIKVALRVRPLSEREIEGGYPVVLAVENNSAFVTDIRVPETPNADSRPRYRQFQFDHGFWLDDGNKEGVPLGAAATQTEIYQEMGPPLEGSVLDGYNACLLAYGQSGTGKTHTMLGSKDDPGLIPRLCHSIWNKLNEGEELGTSRKKFRMEVSFMEIYREKVRDLLKPGGGHLKLREHPQFGPHVQDLSRLEVTQEDGLLDLLWEGEHRRAIGTTGSNHRSSRSHAIWTIYLTREKSANSQTTITNRVHLVDLAGSEKAGFTTAKNLLAEGADINRSLVALGNVISALAEKAQYIPYRDSALTWLLKDSLGGNATTAIIITASPASSSHAQSLNSFRFAQRARLVENKPRINLNLSPLALTINGSGGSGITRSKSGPGGLTSASALYSIMSAFEIKKDISKLSRIIRSAQNNGGILRGLAPRASWTRLVNALEGWNAIESEQLNIQRSRSASLNEATTSSTLTSTPSTTPKDGSPTSDAMIQADLPRTPKTSNSSSNTPTRIMTTGNEVFIPLSTSIKCLTWKQEEVQPPPKLPDSPSKVTGEVDGEEYCSVGMTPPTTPTSSGSSSTSARRKHNFHLLLPVQYPVPQHLDHASRISERIHRSLSALPLGDTARLGIVPDVLMDQGNSPLIRQRIPTLVNCVPAQTPGESALNFAPEQALTVPILSENEIFFSCNEDEGQHGKEIGMDLDLEHDLGLGNDTQRVGAGLGEFAIPQPEVVPIWHHLDPEEEEMIPVKVTSKHRLVPKSLQRKHTLTLQLPPRPSLFTKMLEAKKSGGFDFEVISEGDGEEEVSGDDLELDELKRKLGLGTGFLGGRGDNYDESSSMNETQSSEDDEVGVVENGIFEEEAPQSFSSLNPIPSPSWSKCSEDSDGGSESGNSSSWNFCSGTPKTIPILVKVVPEEREEKDFRLESITEWVKEVTNSAVSTVDLDLDPPTEEGHPDDLEEAPSSLASLSDDPNALPSQPADGSLSMSTPSKYRNHFAREIAQMEEIGQHLKKLRQISTQGQLLHHVQPYLDQIFDLEGADHKLPDPKLDPHIEQCSGWNVDTEMNLVNKEMDALSKLLKIKSNSTLKQIQGGGGRRESGGSGSNGSSHSTLPSSSTTQSQSAGSPQPPNSPTSTPTPTPPMGGHYFRGGRNVIMPMSVSETGARFLSSEFGNSRNSLSDSAVGLGRMSNPGSFPRYEFPYPRPEGHGEVMGYQHPGQYYNEGAPLASGSNPFARMSFELGHGHPEMNQGLSTMSSIMTPHSSPHYQYHSREYMPQDQIKNLYQYSPSRLSSCSSFSIDPDPVEPKSHSGSGRSRSHSTYSYGGGLGHGDTFRRVSDLHEGLTGGSTAATPSDLGYPEPSPFSHIFSTPSSSSTPSNSRIPPYSMSQNSLAGTPEHYMANFNRIERPPPAPSQQYSNPSINSIFQRKHNF